MLKKLGCICVREGELEEVKEKRREEAGGEWNQRAAAAAAAIEGERKSFIRSGQLSSLLLAHIRPSQTRGSNGKYTRKRQKHRRERATAAGARACCLLFGFGRLAIAGGCSSSMSSLRISRPSERSAPPAACSAEARRRFRRFSTNSRPRGQKLWRRTWNEKRAKTTSR